MPKDFQQVTALPAEHVEIADMGIAVQCLLNLQDCSSHAACPSHRSPARHELQTAEQSSTEHSHYTPQRHQADIMPNLDGCSVRQRDLDLAVGRLFHSPC
jgi:hypothetical protein